LVTLTIYASVTIHALNGFVAQTAVDIANAIAAFITGLAIGSTVFYNSIFGPATLYGNPEGTTYNVTALTISIAPGPGSNVDIPIPFNQAAACTAANVTVTVD
jgi:hypothetical protein